MVDRDPKWQYGGWAGPLLIIAIVFYAIVGLVIWWWVT